LVANENIDMRFENLSSPYSTPVRRRLCLRRIKSKRSRLPRSKVDVNESISTDKVSHCGMSGDMFLTRLPAPAFAEREPAAVNRYPLFL
jgi:hypothetical protein